MPHVTSASSRGACGSLRSGVSPERSVKSKSPVLSARTVAGSFIIDIPEAGFGGWCLKCTPRLSAGSSFSFAILF